MSGAARARNRSRSKRGPARPAEERPAADAKTRPPLPFEGRGAVPGQRPVPGREPVGAQVPASQGTPSSGAAPQSEAAQSTASQSAASQSPGRKLQAVPSMPAASESQAPASSGSFARGYAAPADAVRCAMLGSPPTFWFDGDAGRLTIAVESGRLVACGVAHVGEDLAQLVAAVLLNHEGEAADAIEPVRAALLELAERTEHGETEVVVDLSGPSPRLGWLSRFDPAPWVTWHDWWAAFAASPAGRTADAMSGPVARGEFDDCFARQGLRVARCAEPRCAEPLTDRHPAWPGVWSAASGALGPVCAVAAGERAWPAGLLSAHPHRVAEG